MMIEVFQTNVEAPSEAKQIIELLSQHFPGSRINFDLDDSDRILRLEGKDFSAEKVVLLVKEKGYWCDVLE